MTEIPNRKFGITHDSRLGFQNRYHFTKTTDVSRISYWEQMDRINRLTKNPLIEQMDRINRLTKNPLTEQVDYINRLSSLSMNSLLFDLQYKTQVKPFPIYIPSQHLGSGPFDEDTEQDDKDSLTVIRKSDLHPDVIMACGTELSRGDYFHAVQEAIKGILDRIRGITGLTSDGTSLVEEAFRDSKTPYLALNQLATSSEQNVQRGFKHSLISLISMYRNPMSHELRIKWKLDDTEALVVLLQISQCHKRIDSRHYP